MFIKFPKTGMTKTEQNSLFDVLKNRFQKLVSQKRDDKHNLVHFSLFPKANMKKMI